MKQSKLKRDKENKLKRDKEVIEIERDLKRQCKKEPERKTKKK